VVQQQVDRGILSPEEAHDSQYRHLITRALGLKDSVEVDLAEEPVLPGDVLLLCSDGLSDLLEDEEILAIVREHADDLEEACQALVDQANHKGGDDNITAMLIQARAGSDPAGIPATQEVTQKVTRGVPGVMERLREKWGG
jgi:protein phosphatase